jgi:hypothetical protein
MPGSLILWSAQELSDPKGERGAKIADWLKGVVEGPNLDLERPEQPSGALGKAASRSDEPRARPSEESASATPAAERRGRPLSLRPPCQMAPDPPGYPDYCGLRGEGSIPVPLPPPASRRSYVLGAVSLAIGPSSRSHFLFELRTAAKAESVHYSLKARFSPNLWTPPMRYGSRNWIALSYLRSFREKRFGRFSRIARPLFS